MSGTKHSRLPIRGSYSRLPIRGSYSRLRIMIMIHHDQGPTHLPQALSCNKLSQVTSSLMRRALSLCLIKELSQHHHQHHQHHHHDHLDHCYDYNWVKGAYPRFCVMRLMPWATCFNATMCLPVHRVSGLGLVLGLGLGLAIGLKATAKGAFITGITSSFCLPQHFGISHSAAVQLVFCTLRGLQVRVRVAGRVRAPTNINF